MTELNEKNEKVVELYKKGLSMKEIQVKVKLAKVTIQKIIHEYRLQRDLERLKKILEKDLKKESRIYKINSSRILELLFKLKDLEFLNISYVNENSQDHQEVAKKLIKLELVLE